MSSISSTPQFDHLFSREHWIFHARCNNCYCHFYESITEKSWFIQQIQTVTNQWQIKSGGSVMLWGTFSCHGLDPLVLLQGRSLLINTKLLWLITFIPWWNIFIQCLHPQGMRGHWLVWRVWTWCKSYSITAAITRPQPSWTPMRDSGPMC